MIINFRDLYAKLIEELNIQDIQEKQSLWLILASMQTSLCQVEDSERDFTTSTEELKNRLCDLSEVKLDGIINKNQNHANQIIDKYKIIYNRFTDLAEQTSSDVFQNCCEAINKQKNAFWLNHLALFYDCGDIYRKQNKFYKSAECYSKIVDMYPKDHNVNQRLLSDANRRLLALDNLRKKAFSSSISVGQQNFVSFFRIDENSKLSVNRTSHSVSYEKITKKVSFGKNSILCPQYIPFQQNCL